MAIANWQFLSRWISFRRRTSFVVVHKTHNGVIYAQKRICSLCKSSSTQRISLTEFLVHSNHGNGSGDGRWWLRIGMQKPEQVDVWIQRRRRTQKENRRMRECTLSLSSVSSSFRPGGYSWLRIKVHGVFYYVLAGCIEVMFNRKTKNLNFNIIFQYFCGKKLIMIDFV